MKLVCLVSAFLLLWQAKGLTSDVGRLSGQYDKQHRSPGVAIVGAGIGGTFIAHHLRGLLNQSVDLHVFEGHDIGGRVQTFQFQGHAFEAGASIVFAKNYYVRDAADKLELKRVPPEGSTEDVFSIFNGSKLVFQESPWSFVTLYRIIRRYWLTYFKFQAPKQMLQKFLKLYELQSQGRAFETPEAFLQELDLYDLTQQSMHAYLKESLGSSTVARRFATEVVAAVNRVNYNQDSGLNAFAGMVSMLPTVVNDLFKIEGGNVQVPEKLLDHAHANLHHANVTIIQRLPDGTYQIEATEGSETKVFGPFAAVVIATPLELTNIQFKGVDLPHLPPRKFQSTISTFVTGSLNGSYFGLNQAPEGSIMVTEHAGTPFSSIAPAKRFPDKSVLYKLFSSVPLQKADLDRIFGQHQVVGEFPWYAYPKFQPPEQFAPFKLADRLFYSNALENAASCMEISAVSAMNSALLVQQALNQTIVSLPDSIKKQQTMAEL